MNADVDVVADGSVVVVAVDQANSGRLSHVASLVRQGLPSLRLRR